MKRKKVVLLIIGGILLAGLLSMFKYLTFVMKADQEVFASIKSSNSVTVEETGDRIVFIPKDTNCETGLIYYPGGQVEPESFASAAYRIAEGGYLVIIQKMPFNLAMFGVKKSDKIINDYPQIKSWYQSGFSLGGASSCIYLNKSHQKFTGLILYAAYTTPNYDLSKTNLRVKVIYGSNDNLSTPEKIEDTKPYLPKDTVYYEIEGGNHTQFAVYGGGKLQKDDKPASITREEQQSVIVEQTLLFLKEGK